MSKRERLTIIPDELPASINSNKDKFELPDLTFET